VQAADALRSVPNDPNRLRRQVHDSLAIACGRPYSSNVPERINLADPAFEPTDEELMGLSVRAFAGVAAAHRAALERLRADIAAAREQALHALEGRDTAPNET
jgi:hypothetical protein